MMSQLDTIPTIGEKIVLIPIPHKSLPNTIKDIEKTKIPSFLDSLGLKNAIDMEGGGDFIIFDIAIQRDIAESRTKSSIQSS